MIVKITKNSSFSAIVNYANDKKNKSARILCSNGIFLLNNETIADSFSSQLRTPDKDGKVHNLRKPVMHVSIAFSPFDRDRFPNDVSGDRFMRQLAIEWMKEMGIETENAQYVIARHFDKKHPHCHLVINRVLNDGSLIRDSHERYRNETACKNIKKRHGLTFGDNTRQNINPERLRRYERSKHEIRNIVKEAIDTSANWKEFETNLGLKGVRINLCFDPKSAQIRGVTYEKDGFRISGNKLGSHGRYTYGSQTRKFKPFDQEENWLHDRTAKFAIREYLNLVPEDRLNKVPAMPLGTYLQAIKYSAPSVGTGVNREFEVGSHNGRSWDEVDDGKRKRRGHSL